MSHVTRSDRLLLGVLQHVDQAADRLVDAATERVLQRIGGRVMADMLARDRVRDLGVILAGEDRRDVEQLLAVSA